MARPIVWGICGITLVIIAVIFFGFDSAEDYTGSSIFNDKSNVVEENGLVKEVIDGDTFIIEFSNNVDRTVRLLGVDFPDLGNNKINKWLDMGLEESKVTECYNDGIKELNDMLLGKNVVVKLDNKEDNIDSYGRILGYVYFNDLSLSEYLVENGYAVMFDPTEPLCSECLELKEKEGSGCLFN